MSSPSCMFWFTDLNSSPCWVPTFPPWKEITFRKMQRMEFWTQPCTFALATGAAVALGSRDRCDQTWPGWSVFQLHCLFSVLNKLYLNLLNKMMVSKSQNTLHLRYRHSLVFPSEPESCHWHRKQRLLGGPEGFTARVWSLPLPKEAAAPLCLGAGEFKERRVYLNPEFLFRGTKRKKKPGPKIPQQL